MVFILLFRLNRSEFFSPLRQALNYLTGLCRWRQSTNGKLLPVVETVYDDFILSKRKEMALLESVDAKSWGSIMFASHTRPPPKPNLMIQVKMTKIQALPDCNCRKSNKRMVAAIEVRFDFLHFQYHTSMRKNKDWIRVCFLCLWYWLIPLNRILINYKQVFLWWYWLIALYLSNFHFASVSFFVK